MTGMYDQDLPKTEANYQPLTPLTFLERSAHVFPDRIAIVHGSLRRTYRDFYARSRQLASALEQAGVGPGDTVALMLPNIPEMLEAHHGVPMTGAVILALNTRLDPAAIAFQLNHAGAKILLTDREFAKTVSEALDLVTVKPRVIDVDDHEFPQTGAKLGTIDYEGFIAGGDPAYEWRRPTDEWNAIALGYTSGTTGNPKGVVTHNRGAHLAAYANILAAGLPKAPTYLWTLPMFHCNGWCFPWTICAVGGTHVCLRWVRAKAMFDAIADHKVTHMCGAPIVMSTLLNAPAEEKRPIGHVVEFITAAAPPPESVLAAMADAGFNVTHVYGLTEVYGPAVVNEWKTEWDHLPGPARAQKKARQGVRYSALEGLTVLNPRRGHVPRQSRDEGLSQEPRRDRGSTGRWLVPLGRPRGVASRWLYPAEGSLEGHHHLGRGEHFLDRG
jgi:fatty-acyl-CoA synthase